MLWNCAEILDTFSCLKAFLFWNWNVDFPPDCKTRIFPKPKGKHREFEHRSKHVRSYAGVELSNGVWTENGFHTGSLEHHLLSTQRDSYLVKVGLNIKTMAARTTFVPTDLLRGARSRGRTAVDDFIDMSGNWLGSSKRLKHCFGTFYRISILCRWRSKH